MKELSIGFLKFTEENNRFSWMKLGHYQCFTDWFGPADGAGWFKLRIDGQDFVSKQSEQKCLCKTQKKLEFQFSFKNKVSVKVQFSYDKETGVISRKDSVSYAGKEKCTLEDYSAAFPFECGSYEAYTQHSLWCNENIGKWEDLRGGSRELNHVCGRTAEGCTPFTVIRGKYASHAVAFHIIPCGDWKIRLDSVIRYGALPTLSVQCGQPSLHHPLSKGEIWNVPEVCIQSLPDRNEFSGSGLWHQWVLKNSSLPQRTMPLVYNTWLDWSSSFTLERLREQLAAAKKAHCEVFIIDYGWFEDHHYFLRIGDWHEKTDSGLKGKLKDFAKEVKSAGLKLGLWVEAEFFHSSSPIIQKHPEWFAKCNETTYRLRLEKPGAAAYFKETLEDVIKRYHPAYIKNDMNHSQELDDSGKSLQEYAQASAKLFGELRQAHPEIVWESCASGSLRSSVNILKTYDWQFVSDNADPDDNLRIVQGAMLRFPPGKIFSWLVLSGESKATQCKKSSKEFQHVLVPHYATWDNYCSQELNFAILANMNGGLFGISGDLASLSNEEFAILEKYMLFQKKYRDSIVRCSGWLLTPPEERSQFATWVANQFFDPTDRRHYIFAFHQTRFGERTCTFPLHAIEPDKTYRVTQMFPTEGKSKLLRGKELADGFEVNFEYGQQGSWLGQLWIMEEEK